MRWEPVLTRNRSGGYRRVLDVVAAEAVRNERFFDNLKAVMRVPGREWTLLMYFQLRTRLDVIMLRFDQDPRRHDAINTASQLRGLIEAVESMVETDNWEVMDPITKQQYFGLLLDLLRGVVDRDRARDSQGSRSPYVAESRRDVDLYQQMNHGVAHGAEVLQSMFENLSTHGPDVRQIEHIGSMLRAVENRHGLSGTAVVTKSTDPTRVLVAHLRQMQIGKQLAAIITVHADLAVQSNHKANACRLTRLTIVAILLRPDSTLNHFNNIFDTILQTSGAALVALHSIDCCSHEIQVPGRAVPRQSLINIWFSLPLRSLRSLNPSVGQVDRLKEVRR